jgi:hypothetical protein
MAAVAREVEVNALVNMSQMTVSQMSIRNTTTSPQLNQLNFDLSCIAKIKPKEMEL